MKQPVWTFCANSFQFQMDSGSQPYFIRDKMYHKMFKIITEIFEASTKTFQKTIIININLINIYWPTFYCIFKKYGKQSIMVMQMSMDFYQIHWWNQNTFGILWFWWMFQSQTMTFFKTIFLLFCFLLFESRSMNSALGSYWMKLWTECFVKVSLDDQRTQCTTQQ